VVLITFDSRAGGTACFQSRRRITKGADMETMQIAQEMMALCRQGKNMEALDTLFSPDLVSVEAGGPAGEERAAKGLAAVKAKSEWWLANHDIHSAAMTGPWPHDDRFIVGFQYDVTFKPSGQRMQLDEVGLYTVAGGKIVREEFFYTMG
jgi:ketosteroid isomerase-like protein